MNLQKLFETQRLLDEHIEAQHPRQPDEDRLAKKILALQVELGELANEWRGFKFWSENQEPRTKIVHLCPICEGTGDENYQANLENRLEGGEGYPYFKCGDCHGTGRLGESNPLLEEYVDCLHFILSIGLEMETKKQWGHSFKIGNSLIGQIQELYSDLSSLFYHRQMHNYQRAFDLLIGLGDMLGFTWNEIEKAYFEKNEINHERQLRGY